VYCTCSGNAGNERSVFITRPGTPECTDVDVQFQKLPEAVSQCGPEVLFETCVAMKFVDDDDADNGFLVTQPPALKVPSSFLE